MNKVVEFGWGKDGTALWMYYGDTAGGNHGHRDRLNFDIIYRGICMLPDHGYPEATGGWPQRIHATRNTIFHNTVVVNQMQQIHGDCCQSHLSYVRGYVPGFA